MRIEVDGEVIERLERIAQRDGVSLEVLVLQAIATWTFLTDHERNAAAFAASRNALRETQRDRT